MVWAKGTPAANEVKQQIKKHIEARAASADYSSQLSGIRPVVSLDKDPKTGGVRIVIINGPDEELPWEYKDPETGKRVYEEHHRITVGIVADELGGAKRKLTGVSANVPKDEIVFTFLQSVLCERDLLTARGVYNIRPIPEGLEIEGVEFRRQFNIVCNTDVFLT
jgi:hypothetical protein